MDGHLHRSRSRARGAVGAALAALALAGCFSDPTEVVVVVDTDAVPFKDFVQITISITGKLMAPLNTGGTFGVIASTAPLPATVGVTPESGRTEFDVTVTMDTLASQGFQGPESGAPEPFARRSVSHVPFTKDSMRVLFIPMFKRCSCILPSGATSTNCPTALDPECRDLTAPSLPELDEDNIPHLPR